MNGFLGQNRNSLKPNRIRRNPIPAGQRGLAGDGKDLLSFKAQESLSQRDKEHSRPGHFNNSKTSGLLTCVDWTGQSKQIYRGTKIKGTKTLSRTVFGDERTHANNLAVDYRKKKKPPTIKIGTKPVHDAKDHYQQRELTVCEQLSERSFSFISVRQADEIQIDPDYSSENNPGKESKLPPIETYANSLTTQNVSSSRNANDNDQEPELFYDRGSSFCSVRQADDTKVSLQNNSRNSKNNPSKYQLAKAETEQNNTDFCATCLNKNIFSTAIFHCSNCGPCGRYLCQECFERHSELNADHNVQPLSGIYLRKRNHDETNLKEERDTERTELHNNGPYLKFIKDISIKTENDEQPCQITGFCQLQNGTIVLTEMNNKAVKTLDCQNSDQVSSTLRLSNYPMDICSTGGSEALVLTSASTDKCQCVSIAVTDNIEKKRIQVLGHDGKCIAFSNEKTFIGTSKCKSIYIYGKNWSHLDTISKSLSESESIILSNQVSIAAFGHDEVTTMYIVDEQNGVYSIEDNNQGITKRWKFKDHENFKATGMCIDSKGDILLIDRGYQRLIKMNAEGIILAILLDYHDRDGSETLNVPFKDKENNNLIVSLSGTDIIRVFEFN
ncbi:uncharacterized protein LOC123553349 [Mercenaria mercenaria]|uniref:uncharacterized protein LOC123553349 n=1 Tax=Mercenaria mercenaria TaxID=6596 RepID=UPI00234EA512|nr:uncharacterized protein LOC123553349 [Mercenaria mercenaria]